eukprot:TRINITY_DN4363_c0_g2_i1.p1 TRINITY_DN4363_c0_g2~~TRINITY_DN4363_c0_g2_i1.p1  ORF type:complete len:158 (+),score=32.00 TRINITY_DN4363_c0_g2_i1:207-680(+)
MEKGYNIVEAIHDDRAKADKTLQALGITSQKDVWHRGKKLRTKLREELMLRKKVKAKHVEECKILADLNDLSLPALKDWLVGQGLKPMGNKKDNVKMVWGKLSVLRQGAESVPEPIDTVGPSNVSSESVVEPVVYKDDTVGTLSKVTIPQLKMWLKA